jgi:hypothetical protein
MSIRIFLNTVCLVKEIAIKNIKTQICECLCLNFLWNIINTMFFSIVTKFHKESRSVPLGHGTGRLLLGHVL